MTRQCWIGLPCGLLTLASKSGWVRMNARDGGGRRWRERERKKKRECLRADSCVELGMRWEAWSALHDDQRHLRVSECVVLC
ncbi:hypothetical protein GQ42DRAFT_86211 [Ramicandelaber brevisporus]|nr:hypothetical protein GQ42DRAFT_86211 [Ramicandelaber brevisporus]